MAKQCTIEDESSILVCLLWDCLWTSNICRLSGIDDRFTNLSTLPINNNYTINRSEICDGKEFHSSEKKRIQFSMFYFEHSQMFQLNPYPILIKPNLQR